MKNGTPLALLVCAWLAVWFSDVKPASANAGRDPMVMGQAVGEPSGDLAEVHVEAEWLHLDLGTKNAHVAYELRNDGAPRAVRLLFFTPGIANGGRVILNGKALEVTEPILETVPTTWLPPSPIKIHGGKAKGLRFVVNFVRGRNTLMIAYKIAPFEPAVGGYSRRAKRSMHLGYALAPARDFASFGKLNVAVSVSQDWSATVSPALPYKALKTDSGITYFGEFVGLPANFIQIEAMPEPLSPRPWHDMMGLVSVLATLVFGLGFIVGRSRMSWWGQAAICGLMLCIMVIPLAVVSSLLNVGATPSGLGVFIALFFGAGAAISWLSNRRPATPPTPTDRLSRRGNL